MTLTTLDIILIIITVAIAAAMIVILLRRKKFVVKTARRFDDKYSSLLQESESEVRRLKLINDQLNKNSAAKKSPSASSSGESSPGINLERFAMEQKKLEVQQQELFDRNKQLWDMSVSIEKERQHIQQLKSEIEAQHRSVMSSIQYAKLIQNAVLPSKEILKESFDGRLLLDETHWRHRDIHRSRLHGTRRAGSVYEYVGRGFPE